MAEQRPVALDPRPLAARLWTYQAERFPLTSQGMLIVLFALSCVCFGALTRGSPQPPPSESVLIAIVVVFCFFFQFRIADEHRDYDEDVRLRPELPVPNGTITLPELDIFLVGTMAIQLVLTAALHPPLLALLFPPWLWIFLVRNDFFARALPKATWDKPWMASVERVVMVHRLREVVAQLGFTRFEASTPDVEGELQMEDPAG